jgi:uncharacterized membrane protein YdfJ with MMPL/SSD domain
MVRTIVYLIFAIVVLGGLLVPAVMSLLGEHNWYLPRRLDRRLPQATHELQELAAPWDALQEGA